MHAYNLSECSRQFIASTATMYPAPAIVLQVPSYGNVGEDDFLGDLCELVYAKNVGAGFHREDSMRRHYSRCSLPFEGLLDDYRLFDDALIGANPFSDDFYGLDVIEMTEWVGKTHSGPGWAHLKRHVTLYRDTADFLFMAKSDDSGKVQVLCESLCDGCGLSVELVSIARPTPEMILRYMQNRVGHFTSESYSALLDWVRTNSLTGETPLDYLWARSVVAKMRATCINLDNSGDFLDFLNSFKDKRFVFRGKLGF